MISAARRVFTMPFRLGNGFLGLLAACVVIGLAGRVDADTRTECIDSASSAQDLRRDKRLVEARVELLVCARQECPQVIQRDCATWLSEVDASTPTIVVTVRGTVGEDVVVARVFLDGRFLGERLDGKALAVNPGSHRVRVEVAGASPVDQHVLVREGEKNRIVEVQLPQAPIVTQQVSSGAGASPNMQSQSVPTPQAIFQPTPATDLPRSKESLSPGTSRVGGFLAAALITGSPRNAGNGYGAFLRGQLRLRQNFLGSVTAGYVGHMSTEVVVDEDRRTYSADEVLGLGGIRFQPLGVLYGRVQLGGIYFSSRSDHYTDGRINLTAFHTVGAAELGLQLWRFELSVGLLLRLVGRPQISGRAAPTAPQPVIDGMAMDQMRIMTTLAILVAP